MQIKKKKQPRNSVGLEFRTNNAAVESSSLSGAKNYFFSSFLIFYLLGALTV